MGEGWEVVAAVDNEEEGELIAGFLANAGVPAAVESSHSHEFPVTVGSLALVRVEVPSDRLEEARRLLAERETEAASEVAGNGESDPP